MVRLGSARLGSASRTTHIPAAVCVGARPVSKRRLTLAAPTHARMRTCTHVYTDRYFIKKRRVKSVSIQGELVFKGPESSFQPMDRTTVLAVWGIAAQRVQQLWIHHSAQHLLTHPLTHPPTHPPTHSLTHPPTHSVTHSPTHPLTWASVSSAFICNAICSVNNQLWQTRREELSVASFESVSTLASASTSSSGVINQYC